MIDWPKTLVDSIARRRSVIFIGAGVSRHSSGKDGKKPPLWAEFMEKASRRCGNHRHINSAVKAGDYLGACDLIRDRLEEDWLELLREEFVTPKYKPAPIHDIIYRLDSGIVATPNFDKIYDGLALRESEQTAIILNYYDDDITSVLRGDSRVVLKIHGTVDQPRRMVFTKHDYAAARHNYKSFYGIVDALLTTHTFLLLGCGSSDPDVALVFEGNKFVHTPALPHYMTETENLHNDFCELLKKTRNLKILKYDSKSNHVELVLSLKKLLALVESRRDEIASTQSW